ncbi:MAG: hypothetical protein GY797_19425 [Deltaproteobacteria bacterium]|nr:hypothetical protein [Deltaproteobacteria bacterium]
MNSTSNTRDLTDILDFTDVLDFGDMLERELKRFVNKLKKDVEDGLLDDFLDALLRIMKLTFWLDGDFRKNIKDFDARYTFKSKDKGIAASAIFKRDKMEVKRHEIHDTNATVIFKDNKSLWEFLFSDDLDVFAFVLDNRLSFEGNLNYILKFAYMAKHLQLMFGL